MSERDPLTAYRRKREPGRTPEPGVSPASPPATGGCPTPGLGGLFVIHKHAASRLHWDLRLELDGVLASWAVPKGPSLDPAEKRLAVLVENHPIEYVDFEDVIPEGSYGAGPMIIWDRGTWIPLVDPRAGLSSGKLLFELRGYKLRGTWTLVRLAKTERDWLLIRERRHMSTADRQRAPEADRRLPQESILSGLTVEELGTGLDRSRDYHQRTDSLGAARRALSPESVGLMLAHPASGPFNDPGWLFELKLDGYRMLGHKSGASARLVTRNGNDATGSFPELVRALRSLPVTNALIDGELVVQDDEGLPRFQRLQQRARLRRPADIKRASLRSPSTFYAFDILGLVGRDLRSLPLVERKRLLHDLLPPVGPIRYVEHFVEAGEAVYEKVVAMRLEGIMAKRLDSRYRGGRSRSWLKIRAESTGDFVIVGYTDPRASRDGFGALHLAAVEGDVHTYVGRVGTGFPASDLRDIRDRLDGLRAADPPEQGPAPKGSNHHWIEPRLVCEVRYLEWTADGLLRQPVFLRLREDKEPGECGLPEARAVGAAPPADRDPKVRPPATREDGVAGERAAPRLSNPDKVFWPEAGYTKRDLFEYYRAIAPWLLPYLADRPLVLTRYPDGIAGKSFYQKNVPVSTPEWIRTERVRGERSDRETEYFVCDDVATLLYLANLGTIPLHVWASRVAALDRPDWCILDLDPKGAPFEHVIRIARVIHRVCEGMDLPSFVKTSGSSGLHVLVPLGGRLTFEQSRTLGELLARLVLSETPDIATVARRPDAREGKVYIDYLQNREGQLLAAPFSARPVPGACVSTPLRWRDVNASLDIRRYTIRSVPRRLRRMGEDPMAPLLNTKPDLASALQRLTAAVEETG